MKTSRKQDTIKFQPYPTINTIPGPLLHKKETDLLQLRVLCGHRIKVIMSVFQTDDTGSIPVARSNLQKLS